MPGWAVGLLLTMSKSAHLWCAGCMPNVNVSLELGSLFMTCPRALCRLAVHMEGGDFLGASCLLLHLPKDSFRDIDWIMDFSPQSPFSDFAVVEGRGHRTEVDEACDEAHIPRFHSE